MAFLGFRMKRKKNQICNDIYAKPSAMCFNDLETILYYKHFDVLANFPTQVTVTYKFLIFPQEWSSSFYQMCVGVTWSTWLLIHLQVWQHLYNFKRLVTFWFVRYSRLRGLDSRPVHGSLYVYLGERLSVPVITQEEKCVHVGNLNFKNSGWDTRG